jgi:hypothetical protein
MIALRDGIASRWRASSSREEWPKRGNALVNRGYRWLRTARLAPLYSPRRFANGVFRALPSPGKQGSSLEK